MSEIFRIGTRNSPLALCQADILLGALSAAHADIKFEIVPIQSNADWKKGMGEKPLIEEAGGKGLFAKEIEEKILNGEVDCGVHSTKDMASFLPEGLEINHVLPRADARDAFISLKYESIDEMPEGAVIGTCSPRRQSLALSMRPDLKIVPFRGNVGTRMEKIRNEQVDATFLAMAGLERLGVQDEMIHALSVEAFLPACGQGVVCMEMRAGNERAKEILDAVHCTDTGLCVAAEREALKVLDGSCHTPIGAYATVDEGFMRVKVQVLSLDGQDVYVQSIEQECGDIAQALSIGKALGQLLRAQVPEGILVV